MSEYPKMIYPDGPFGTGIPVKDAEEEKARMKDKLRTDGPTIETWLTDGFKAKDYPPKGYASRSSEAKVKAAIEAENNGNS